LKLNFVVNYISLNYDNSESADKKEEKFCQRKAQQTSQARTSALDQINNIIKEGHIDFTTLNESTFFSGESYLQA